MDGERIRDTYNEGIKLLHQTGRYQKCYSSYVKSSRLCD